MVTTDDVLNNVIAHNLIFMCEMELSANPEDEHHAKVVGALCIIRQALAAKHLSMEDFLISRGILDAKKS